MTSADDTYYTFWRDSTGRVTDIRWPDGMKYLLFDFDGEAVTRPFRVVES